MRSRPPPHPKQVRLVRTAAADLVDYLAEEEMVIFWTWKMSKRGHEARVNEELVYLTRHKLCDKKAHQQRNNVTARQAKEKGYRVHGKLPGQLSRVRITESARGSSL